MLMAIFLFIILFFDVYMQPDEIANLPLGRSEIAVFSHWLLVGIPMPTQQIHFGRSRPKLVRVQVHRYAFSASMCTMQDFATWHAQRRNSVAVDLPGDFLPVELLWTLVNVIWSFNFAAGILNHGRWRYV